MAAGPSILIIGAGSMGRALALGMREQADDRVTTDLRVYDVHEARAKALATDAGAAVVSDLNSAGARANVVVLCIKPHDLANLASQLVQPFEAATLLISFLAGTTMDAIATTLRFNGAIVRAMPNICAKVGLAATGAARNVHCDDAHAALAESILRSVGNLHWLKEDLMDAVTGLSGSGPAYVFMVIEAMTDGGVKMGLPRDVAYSLAVQTVAGAAKLLEESGQHPALLKDQVTTPGGTTINAIHELETHGLRSMFISAIAMATRKSKDLRRPPEEREMD